MKQLSDKIIILDNVLTVEECNFLIECYDKAGPTHSWLSFFPMTINNSNINIKPFYKQIDVLVNKISNKICHAVSEKINIDWCEIVKWPTDSFMPIHTDTSSEKTVFTSITYLNNNFSGGELFIENDFKLNIKVGRTVCFDGKYYRHGVSQVLNGSRYSLPIWYCK